MIGTVRVGRHAALAMLFALAACGTKEVSTTPPEETKPDPIVIGDATLPDTTVGLKYVGAVAAKGGKAPLAFAAQGLPEGLVLDAASGAVSGSATAAGDATVNVTVSDAAGQSEKRAFPLKVFEAPAIRTDKLPDATAGVAYSQAITTAGGKAPVTLSLADGDLPPELTLADGKLSGTPSAAAKLAFSVAATDGNGAVVKKAFTLNVSPKLVISTSALPGGEVGVLYAADVKVDGGTAPVEVKVTALPQGLTFDAGALRIEGTPTAAGTAMVQVDASDARGAKAQATLSLVVADAVALTAMLPDGYAGKPYADALHGTGGVTPYTFRVTTGALPAGLSLDATGAIVGTPSASGAASFTAELKDKLGATASKALLLTVHDPVKVTPGAPPVGNVGLAYTAQFSATGGKAPLAFSATGTPPGLAVSATGFLSGTPTAGGSYFIDVTARDANGESDTARFGLVIAANPPPSITTTSLQPAVVGAAYTGNIVASGGTPPLSFSITSGGLPAGISLSTTGALSGTASAKGTSAFEVTVVDANKQSGKANLDLAVVDPLALAPATLPDAYAGKGFAATLTASGGRAPYAFSVRSGTLPGGIVLDSASGALSGTPSTAGTTGLTLAVSDASGQSAVLAYTLEVLAGPSISGTLADGSVGANYSQALQGTGGRAPYTFRVASGALPNGLAVSSAGAITGTPTAAGTSNFTLEIKDANGQVGSRSLSIAVFAGVAVTSATLPDAYTGRAYQTTLAAIGGKSPYTWAADASLPAGLTLAADGKLTGTPTQTSAGSFTATATDANGSSNSKQLALTVLAPPTISTATLAEGTVGTTYTQALAPAGGRSPFTYAVTTGAPPSGLSLSSAGVLSGTPAPAAAGKTSFTVTLTDANGVTGTQAFDLTVYPALSVVTAALPDGYVGAAYSASVTSAGGKAPVTFAITSGTPPAGVSLSSAGAFSGTPSATASTTLTVTATDALQNTFARSLTLTVYAKPSIDTTALAEGTQGVSYNASLAASGGKAPLTFKLKTGAFPAGITLSASGAFSGTPTASGTASFDVEVTDANGITATRSLSITIYAPVSVATASVPDGTTSFAYSTTLTAAGGKSPYTWSTTAGAVAPGLNLASSGTLSGTPTTTGTFTFTAQVKDALGNTATKQFTHAMKAAVAVSISPQTATVFTGATQTFSATVTGSTNTAVVWSVVESGGGTIDQAGKYTAPAGTGTFHVRATSVADSTQYAEATVTVKIQVTVKVTPTTIQLGTGETQRFTATVTGPTNTSVVWSVQEGAAGGSVDTTGLYTPPSTAGTYHVVATSVADPSSSATATVVVSAQPVAVTICPDTTALFVGESLRFTATVNAPGGASWSITGAPAGASIDVTGLFKSTAAGTYTVVATANANPGKTASATVRVTTATVGTIGGTVSYGGTLTGRIFVELLSGNGIGTSIADTSQSYLLRGVSAPTNSTVQVRAWMDVLGTGSFAPGADPSGTVNLTWNGTSASNVLVALTDPALATLTAPIIDAVAPSSSSALVLFRPLQDSQGNDGVVTYKLYASQSPNPGPTDSSSKITVLRAGSGDAALADGLTDGKPYYFAISGVQGGREGPLSAVSGPVTIGARSGGTSISGAVDISGAPPTGTLLVYAFASSTQIYFARIASPQAHQTFTITGVTPGTYQYGAILDDPHPGELGDDDLRTSFDIQPTVTVGSTPVSGITLALGMPPGLRVISEHRKDAGQADAYAVILDVPRSQKVPVRAWVVSGIGATPGQDLGLSGGGSSAFSVYVPVGATPPAVGSSYTVDVTTADGVTCAYSASVTAVLAGLPVPLSPSATGATTSPLFTWNPPSPAPANLASYEVYIYQQGSSFQGYWEWRQASSAARAVAYNADGTGVPLSAGQTYQWQLAAFDAQGNRAVVTNPFTTSAGRATVTVTPANGEVAVGETLKLTATVSGSTDKRILWSVQEGAAGGSVDASGLYTPPSTTGTYHVVATSLADSGASAVSTIVVSSTPVTVSICPDVTALVVGEPLRFTATLNSLAGATWSVAGSPSGATINASGVFSATTAGTYSVVATANSNPGKTATASVQVVNATFGTIAGKVSYGGTLTGRVYVTATNGTGSGVFTSVADTTQSYLLRGIDAQQNQQVQVQAWIDVLGTGHFSPAADPSGTATVTWNGANVANLQIALADPKTLTLAAPSLSGVAPSSSSALVFFRRALDAQNNDLASHYRIYASQNANPGPADAASKRVTVRAGEGDVAMVDGLTDGKPYYFAMSVLQNGREGPLSPVSGPFAIGARSGGTTVSGTVTLSGVTPGGILYVYAVDNTAGQVFYARVPSPQASQSFTITGVAPGTYEYGAVLDVAHPGEFGEDDLSSLNGSSGTVTVSSTPVSGLSLTLTPADNKVAVTTEHFRDVSSTDWYSANLGVDRWLRMPVRAWVVSGTGTAPAHDLGLNGGNGGPSASVSTGNIAPAVGATYVLNVTFDDGVTCAVRGSVSAVLAGVPTPTAPKGSGVTSAPTFTWSAPSPTPANLDKYWVYVFQQTPTFAGYWFYEQAATQPRSVTYNADGTAATATLADGDYFWEVAAIDAQGNRSVAQVPFTVGGAVSTGVSFTNDVLPVFQRNCAGCHTGGGSSGGLQLDAAVAYGNLVNVSSPNYGLKRVVPSDTANSLVWIRTSGGNGSITPMPAGSPGLKTTNNADFLTLEKWIQQGAKNN